MTRIIAGVARGQHISVPRVGTRPSSDRLRESLFSSLESWLHGEGLNWSTTVFFDLFSGSGAVALEAKSRGAARVVAVDSRHVSTAVISENASKIALALEVHTADVYTWKLPSAATIIFIDPPYEHTDDQCRSLLHRIMEHCESKNLLIVYERGRRSSDPFIAEHRDFEVITWSRRYGDSVLWYGHVERRVR